MLKIWCERRFYCLKTTSHPEFFPKVSWRWRAVKVLTDFLCYSSCKMVEAKNQETHKFFMEFRATFPLLHFSSTTPTRNGLCHYKALVFRKHSTRNDSYAALGKRIINCFLKLVRITLFEGKDML